MTNSIAQQNNINELMILDDTASKTISNQTDNGSIEKDTFSNLVNCANSKANKTETNFIKKAIKSNTSSINKLAIKDNNTKDDINVEENNEQIEAIVDTTTNETIVLEENTEIDTIVENVVVENEIKDNEQIDSEIENTNTILEPKEEKKENTDIITDPLEPQQISLDIDLSYDEEIKTDDTTNSDETNFYQDIEISKNTEEKNQNFENKSNNQNPDETISPKNQEKTVDFKNDLTDKTENILTKDENTENEIKTNTEKEDIEPILDEDDIKYETKNEAIATDKNEVEPVKIKDKPNKNLLAKIAKVLENQTKETVDKSENSTQNNSKVIELKNVVNLKDVKTENLDTVSIKPEANIDSSNNEVEAPKITLENIKVNENKTIEDNSTDKISIKSNLSNDKTYNVEYVEPKEKYGEISKDKEKIQLNTNKKINENTDDTDIKLEKELLSIRQKPKEEFVPKSINEKSNHLEAKVENELEIEFVSKNSNSSDDIEVKDMNIEKGEIISVKNLINKEDTKKEIKIVNLKNGKEIIPKELKKTINNDVDINVEAETDLDINIEADVEADNNIKPINTKNETENTEKRAYIKDMAQKMLKNMMSESGSLTVQDEVKRLSIEDSIKGVENNNLVNFNFKKITSDNPISPKNNEFNLNKNNILEQVTNEFSKIRTDIKGNQRLTMVLRPENLGRLQLDLKLNSEGLTANILAQNQDVKNYIEKNLHQLKAKLIDSGVNVNNIQIKTMGENGYTSLDFSKNNDQNNSLLNQNNNSSNNQNQNNNQEKHQNKEDMENLFNNNYDTHFKKDFSGILSNSISYGTNQIF